MIYRKGEVMNEQTPAVHSFPNRDAIREMAQMSCENSQRRTVCTAEECKKSNCTNNTQIQRKESDSLLPLLFALIFLTDTQEAGDASLLSALLAAISII